MSLISPGILDEKLFVAILLALIVSDLKGGLNKYISKVKNVYLRLFVHLICYMFVLSVSIIILILVLFLLEKFGYFF